jgi:16S rRNA (guanine527-N7)-methyltransferase
VGEDNITKLEQAPNWRIKVWFPEFDENTHELLKQYWLELQKFNNVINLISRKTMLNADAIHFADSIKGSQIVRKKANKNDTLYDLGSGNGFPGLVYGILYPDQRVVLVDSDERKCEFLKHVIVVLGLSNVEVLNKKIFNLPEGTIEQAICRGFAPLPRALLMLRKILTNDGVIYHLKSDEWAIEVSQIPSQLCSFWQAALEEDYIVPISEVRMYVVRTSRID